MSVALAHGHPNHDIAHVKATYIALYDLNFDWLETEIVRFEEMWRAGVSVKQIAKVLQRDPDEVVILAMDRARKGKIAPRKCGLQGD